MEKEVIAHRVEDVTVLGVTADSVEVIELGLEFFEEKCFGFSARGNGILYEGKSIRGTVKLAPRLPI